MRRRPLLLVGLAVVLGVVVSVTSCHVYTKASFDLPVSAGYTVRTYHIRAPLRIAGENVKSLGPHPSQAEPVGTDLGYEAWLARASGESPRSRRRSHALRQPGKTAGSSRICSRGPGRCSGSSVSGTDARLRGSPARLRLLGGAGFVRLVERDPRGTVTFLQDVHPGPAFLEGG